MWFLFRLLSCSMLRSRLTFSFLSSSLTYIYTEIEWRSIWTTVSQPRGLWPTVLSAPELRACAFYFSSVAVFCFCSSGLEEEQLPSCFCLCDLVHSSSVAQRSGLWQEAETPARGDFNALCMTWNTSFPLLGGFVLQEPIPVHPSRLCFLDFLTGGANVEN